MTDYLLVTAMASPLLLAVGGIVCYCYAHLAKGAWRAWTGTVSLAFFLVAFLILVAVTMRGIDNSSETVFAVLRPNHLGLLIALLATGLGAVASLYSQGTLDREGPVSHFYALLLFAVAGTVAIGFAVDLFTMFVMVELSALPSYALVAYDFSRRRAAVAAAIKYFIQGVVGTLTALLGISLLYMLAGSLDVGRLQLGLAGSSGQLLTLAAILVITGYGVKIALVPFHTWLPDAYCYAPAGVTAIMAGVTKAGSLVALFRTLAAMPMASIDAAQIGLVVVMFSILTMTVGNLMALGQRDLRRMLAYSSVAQMGYILLGFGIGLQYSVGAGIAAGVFYLVIYGIMKGGAFLCAGAFSRATNGGRTFEDLRGIGAKSPVVGTSFALFVLGLIGIPTTAGFPGKLLLFQAGLAPMAGNTWFNWGTLLIIALAFNSALSLGYYAPALNNILFKQGHESRANTPRIPVSVTVAVVSLAVATVLLGLYPKAAMDLVNPASTFFRPGGWP